MLRPLLRNLGPLPALLAALAIGCSSDPDAPADGPAPAVDAGADAPVTIPNEAGGGCPVLAFPSGLHLATKTDAEASDSYASISDDRNYAKPTCFIDTNDLRDPVAQATVDDTAKLSDHFTLHELVGTEAPYSHFVLVSPVLIAKLEAFRAALGGESVSITSGYRSPAHQRKVCRDMCGADSCPGTCAARSRHSWGDAADIGVIPTKRYGDAGCKAEFNYVYLEGNHLHLDLNPEHPVCTVDIL